MPRSLPFCLVDVFADTPLTGNPLAVVADADDIEERLMRQAGRVAGRAGRRRDAP